MLSISCRLLFLHLLLAVFHCNAQKKLSNIDFLGLGYDLIYGNPHSNLHDPGFRDAVLRLEYDRNLTSSDGKWLVPDNVEALQTYGCGYETEATIIHGASSYSESLTVDAHVETRIFFYKFSASAGYKEVHKGSYEFHRSYVSSKAKCLLYHASIERFTASRVTDQFFKAVMNLPITRNDEQYIRFINAFGTHYASALGMGAKAIMRSEFDATTWSKLDSENFNFEGAAQASFLFFAGAGVQASTEQTKEQAASFDSNRSSVMASYMGCRPSSDGKWETWSSNAEQSPYPITYKLRPLTELLTPQFFPNVSADDLAEKQGLLNSTYEIYCHNTPGCGQPEEDVVPVKMDRPDAAIIGTQRVSCRQGYSLLSCGLSNLPYDTSEESKRCAVPIDSTTCECYANYGEICQPWCTNTANELERKVSEFTKDDFRVDCPKGKQVVGCAVDPRQSSGDEWLRGHFPTDDGTGCVCHAEDGAICIATCASNFKSYEVRSQYGLNSVTVKCSPNNYVFGCGISPRQGSSREAFRTFTASSIDSCTCYDKNGVICYAICGQFNV